jgi:hypothetical protein
MKNNNSNHELSQTVFETAFDLLIKERTGVPKYQKEIDSATGTGNQSKTPEADDAYTGGIYNEG